MLRLLLRLTARLLLGGSMLVARILVSSGCTSTVTPAATGAPPLVVLLRALVLLRTAATLRLRLSRLLVQRVTGLESVGRTEAILERSGVVAGDQGVVARRFRDDCRVALLPSWVVRA